MVPGWCWLLSRAGTEIMIGTDSSLGSLNHWPTSGSKLAGKIHPLPWPGLFTRDHDEPTDGKFTDL